MRLPWVRRRASELPASCQVQEASGHLAWPVSWKNSHLLTVVKILTRLSTLGSLSSFLSASFFPPQYQGWLFSCSVVSNSVTPWTASCQAPLAMGFPRQENWTALPFPSPGDLPDPEMEPASPALAGRLQILYH